MHKKYKLEYEAHSNMTNMQKYAPSFADGALQLQVGVGLTRMAATHGVPLQKSLEISSRLILGYPYLRNLYQDIQGYPDLPRVLFFQMELCSLSNKL